MNGSADPASSTDRIVITEALAEHLGALRAAFDSLPRRVWRIALTLIEEPDVPLVELAAREGTDVASVERIRSRVQGTDMVDETVRTILARYQEVCGYPRRSPTPARRKIVRARLAEGFTVADFEAVFAWVVNDDFRRGKYDDIEHLFRSRERFDQNLERAKAPVKIKSTQAMMGVKVSQQVGKRWDPGQKKWVEVS